MHVYLQQRTISVFSDEHLAFSAGLKNVLVYTQSKGCRYKRSIRVGRVIEVNGFSVLFLEINPFKSGFTCEIVETVLLEDLVDQWEELPHLWGHLLTRQTVSQ